MGDIVKQILAKPIQLSDQVIKATNEASHFKQDCDELKVKTEKLAGLLRQATRVSSDLYDSPTRRIIDDTEQMLEKTLYLVLKCGDNGCMKRVFTMIPTVAFSVMSARLENSIGNVSWLLCLSTLAEDRGDASYLGLPPIAGNDPILCLIWGQIAILLTGSLEERSDAASLLETLARDNDRYTKLIIQEGGVVPLLKLLEEGNPEGQENAACALGLLGHDPESLDHIIPAIWLLVDHLAFETVEENINYAVANKAKEKPYSSSTKFQIKAMAARALWELAKDNSTICKIITESRALLCFAALIEKGIGEVRYNSAMALMEITAVAEKDSNLRRSAFKPNSPVVNQVLRIIEIKDSELLIPCIRIIGNLARTFRATETRIIRSLVKLLEEREPEVIGEALTTLTKFACTHNYLHKDHSRGIIEAGGCRHLVQLAYFRQIPALVLLCYLAHNVPDNEQLAKDEVLAVLEWASKHYWVTHLESLEALLLEAKSRLEDPVVSISVDSLFDF